MASIRAGEARTSFDWDLRHGADRVSRLVWPFLDRFR